MIITGRKYLYWGYIFFSIFHPFFLNMISFYFLIIVHILCGMGRKSQCISFAFPSLGSVASFLLFVICKSHLTYIRKLSIVWEFKTLSLANTSSQLYVSLSKDLYTIYYWLPNNQLKLHVHVCDLDVWKLHCFDIWINVILILNCKLTTTFVL